MPTRKEWDHMIDIKEGFVPRKEKVYPLSREERRSKGICKGAVAKGIYLAIKVTPNSTSVLCRKERQKEANGAGLQVSQQVDN